jgi:PncC family amidohydrolase
MDDASIAALAALADDIGPKLAARGETVAVAESAAGGLIAAALIGVPGASAFFRAGAVVYTPKARVTLLGLTRADLDGLRGASEAYAGLLAQRARDRFAATWAISETGAAGPNGNPYGDPAGHVCVAVSGPNGTLTRTVRTGLSDRRANMTIFAANALKLLAEQL